MPSIGLFCILLVCIQLRICQGSHHQSFYTVVQAKDSETSKSQPYLLYRQKVARLIDDDRTVRSLGFDISQLETITSEQLSKYQLGAPLPAIYMAARNADEAMKVQLLKSTYLQGKLLHNISHIGDYINPGVVAFKGRFLMVTGLAWSLDFMNEGHPPNEFIYHRWLNLTISPYASNKPYLGLTHRISPTEPFTMLGQDPRLLTLGSGEDEQIHMTFTNRFVRPMRMAKAVLGVNKTTGNLEVLDYLFSIAVASPHPHKNWMPFIYNTTKIYYVSFVNPLEIVEIGPRRARIGDSDADALLISNAPHAEVDWDQGELRGGTNAIFLPRYGVYLAIFHSSTCIDGGALTTYFMGAMTFSAHPPFRLIAMSPLPIMDEYLYNGKFHRNAGAAGADCSCRSLGSAEEPPHRLRLLPFVALHGPA